MNTNRLANRAAYACLVVSVLVWAQFSSGEATAQTNEPVTAGQPNEPAAVPQTKEPAPAARPGESPPAQTEASTTPPQKPVARTAADPAAAGIETPEPLKGVKKVAITTFTVEFLTYLQASTEGNWGNLIGGKPNNVSVTMKGHDPAQWQPVVDTLYDRVVDSLRQTGIEVVPHDTLRALPEYKTLLDAAKKTPHEEDAKAGRGLYFSARDLPMIIQDEAQVYRKPGFAFRGGLFGSKPPEDLYITFGSKLGAGFTSGRVQNEEQQIAKKLDAHVMKVRLTVVPTQVSQKKSFWVGSSVSTNASLALVPFVNRYLFYSPSGDHSRISLVKDLVSVRTVGEMKDVTSGGAKVSEAAGVALRIVGALAGASTRGAVSKKQDFEVSVDNTAYSEMVAQQLDTVHGLFLDKLRAARGVGQ